MAEEILYACLLPFSTVAYPETAIPMSFSNQALEKSWNVNRAETFAPA